MSDSKNQSVDEAAEVVVFRRTTHGLSIEAYAEALRERLSNDSVKLARTPREEREFLEGATVATGVDISADHLTHADRLRLFACAFAGIDHLPLDELERRNIAVTNASGIHSSNIAEQVLGYVLVFARRLDEGLRRQSNREWRHYQAHELAGSTVTIVGLGAIGHEVTRRLNGFDVDSIGIRYTPSKGGPTDRVCGFESDEFHDALAETDYLVLAAPLSETTRGLVDEEALITLPSNAVVINVSRGELVDTEALVRVLGRQDIRGAALDVTDPEPLPSDHPLWRFENTIITPHNAGHTPNHWNRLADVVSQNVERIRETGETTDLENQIR